MPRSCCASCSFTWPPPVRARSVWTAFHASRVRRPNITPRPDTAGLTSFDLRRRPMSTRPYPVAKPLVENPRPIVAGAKIGHVHLKVANLDRALAFYTGVLGFELMQRFGN